ncbi:hypothetical protein Rsub_10307 [Raphidocelis subcapitata]|uniref:RRM domain-containing protein n=1 Tax=Raphidocelis subcapitata TaxID=307507 RepID=A0A2V0PEX8_9CHLO|nr:hypothetical protein Rsub_10307 [Raphidocelis subcapitata]|eukprot:GBF98079.1 hypothetical protein Rsub_10307 [Raphidocelis subcapitata]
MQRGRKQGLWVGRRVPEVDEKGAPLLYRRYTRVEEVLEGNAQKQQQKQSGKRAAASDDSGSDSGSDSDSDSDSDSGSGSEEAAPAVQKAAKKQKQDAALQPQQTQQQQQQQQKPSEAGADATKLSKKEKKRLRQQQQQGQEQEQGAAGDAGEAAEQHQAAAKQSGEGNAAQAQQIRGVLGFENGSAPPAGRFAFSFDAEVVAQVEAETEAKLARLHAIDSADKDGNVPRRVFVGGMPYSYSREQIEEYWGWCGEIESMDMLTFPDSGRFRGIAFITFKTQEGYEAALACDGEALDGQTLKVDKCKAAAGASKRGGSAPSAVAPGPAAAAAPASNGPAAAASNRGGAAGGSGRPAKTPGYNVAYVGNVAFEVTREELAEVFSDCGVKLVRLHTDQATGRSKGYAHVHFEDEAGLDRAMELDGHVMRGRGIRVSYGQPKRSG